MNCPVWWIVTTPTKLQVSLATVRAMDLQSLHQKLGGWLRTSTPPDSGDPQGILLLCSIVASSIAPDLGTTSFLPPCLSFLPPLAEKFTGMAAWRSWTNQIKGLKVGHMDLSIHHLAGTGSSRKKTYLFGIWSRKNLVGTWGRSISLGLEFFGPVTLKKMEAAKEENKIGPVVICCHPIIKHGY